MFISSWGKNYSSHTFWQQKQNVVASLTFSLCTTIDKSTIWWAFENVEDNFYLFTYVPSYKTEKSTKKDEKWKNGNENAKKADDNCLKFKSQGRKRCL